MNYPGNGTPGGDIGLDWKGPNIPSRINHTILWQWVGRDQNGFFAVAWHANNDGTWHGYSQPEYSPMYEFGTHPFPYRAEAGISSDGQATYPSDYKSGNIQYMEIAGLIAAGRDFLASPGPGSAYRFVPGHVYKQARTCRVIVGGPNNGKLEHLFYVDLPDTTKVIRQVAPSGWPTPNAPVFRFGASPWTGNGSSNSETPNGILRAFKMFPALSTADMLAESASDQVNTPATANPPWYINVNPTPTDVSDKSGAGHHPVWANSNRPSLYVK
ncbi:MAG TPA: hypothetical protein VJ385_12055 [Fibrobacteria bacterium]|nr:hypothetical protein [Fibrobacteria bacterium]